MVMEPLVTNPPPLIEKVPPTMLTGEAILIPVMVAAGMDVIRDDCATLDCGVKLYGAGTAFGIIAVVVTEKVAATPPTFTVAEVSAPAVAADNTLTARVWLLLMKPLVTNAPPPIEKSPPTMLTGEAILIPVMMAAGTDVIRVDCATLVCGVKLNGAGVALPATGTVVTENVPIVPPTLSVAEVVARFRLDDCNCTMMDWPLLTIEEMVLNDSPPSIE